MDDGVQTRNVFLDTECFYGAGFNYSSKPMRILIALAAKGEVKVYVTDITRREVMAHITEAVEEAVRLHKRFANEARILQNSELKTSRRVLMVPEADALKKELFSQFESFLQQSEATVLPATDVKLGTILDAYFQSEPPFGAGKKKAEFPDAFALAALKEWCEDNDEKMYVISGDGDLRDACKDGGQLHHLPKLTDFLVLLASDNEALAAFVRGEVERRSEQIKEEIEKAFTGDLGFILEDQDGDVADVEVSDVFIGEFEILETTGEHADLQTEATVKFNADLSYVDQGNSVWDSEDEVFIFTEYANETVEREETVGADISVSFKGLDPESFGIDKVSIAGPKRDILVSSSADEGWPYK